LSDVDPRSISLKVKKVRIVFLRITPFKIVVECRDKKLNVAY